MLAIPLAQLIVPLFLLLTQYPTHDFNFFKFLVPEQTGEISVFVQIIFIEFWLEVLRLSSLHTPANMESAF